MPADQATASALLASITDRQRAVLDLVVQHWTSKEIARELGISPSTVDQRINAVRAKLGARDRAETARIYAELNGICGRTLYGPAVVADAAPIALPIQQDGVAEPVIMFRQSGPGGPAELDRLIGLIVPRARLRDGKLWRLVAIVLIAMGVAVLATNILAVMQALNAMV